MLMTLESSTKHTIEYSLQETRTNKNLDLHVIYTATPKETKISIIPAGCMTQRGKRKYVLEGPFEYSSARINDLPVSVKTLKQLIIPKIIDVMLHDPELPEEIREQIESP